jgi:hypothetical protein
MWIKSEDDELSEPELFKKSMESWKIIKEWEIQFASEHLGNSSYWIITWVDRIKLKNYWNLREKLELMIDHFWTMFQLQFQMTFF